MPEKIDLINYWKKQSKIVHWFNDPKKILINKKDTNLFFDDGTINIAYNCIKNNIENGNGYKTALIFVDENNHKQFISYEELENL
tara:strand:- start:4947 stop:5201 length:255 start_codon:yes stop_codon:yes gene_type:complete